jgi:cell division protein FtsB
MGVGRWSWVAIGLGGILIFLQYQLWFEAGGVYDLMKLKKALAMQKSETEKLKIRNETLLFQIGRLQNSQDATETRARNELGMIKKGETFYHIVK